MTLPPRSKPEFADPEEVQRNIAAKLRSVAGVPLRYDFALLSGLHPEQRDVGAALNHLIDEPGMVALVGARGGGKTYLACAIIHLFCERNKPAMYRRTMDVFMDLKASFGKSDSDQRRIVAGYEKPDLLVLDEFQVRSDTEWENMVLTDLLDRRYTALKSTILIGNLSPEEFSRRVGESVVSRMTETGGIIVCNWPSFRTRKA